MGTQNFQLHQLHQIHQLHQFMKDKPVQSFLIIIVLILLIYYIYIKFFRKEHYNINNMGLSGTIFGISLCILCLFIPYIILYYIIKIANKNAIKETSQNQSKSK